MEKKDFRIVTLACKEENIVKAHKMDKKLSLEEQVKALQSHFGAVVNTVKQLKTSVDNLKSIVGNASNGCIKEVMEKQQMIDKDISANADTVKRLDREIKSILKDKTKKEANKQEVEDAIKQLETEILKLKQVKRYKNRVKIKRQKRSANISTLATVSTMGIANLFTLKKYVKNINKANVMETNVQIDILKLANGLKHGKDVEEEKHVTFLMTLLFVMVRKIKHRKMRRSNSTVFHANMNGKTETVL